MSFTREYEDGDEVLYRDGDDAKLWVVDRYNEATDRYELRSAVGTICRRWSLPADLRRASSEEIERILTALIGGDLS